MVYLVLYIDKKGKIEGNWLIINPDKAKTHRTREIELSPLMHQIYDEMILRYQKLSSDPYNYKQRSITGRYSKVFKDACREIGSGDRKFHNLRDTFAIRLWAITGDIHYVSKVIGHTSVTMTEKYANFNVRRLICDFPSLSKYI
jgi:integrase